MAEMADHGGIDCDVLIIGAGPAGCVAGALLSQSGHRVRIVEREWFPRFSIGESLLPQAMVWLDEAGFLEPLQRAGFQSKDGAVFSMGQKRQIIDFAKKFSEGPFKTWQVPRDKFDQILANEVQKRGVEIDFGCQVTNVVVSQPVVTVEYMRDNGARQECRARFLLDASGFGRVLARSLGIDRPGAFPERIAIFRHFRDTISDPSFDREKILISVHPECRDIWFWLIPFNDGRLSVGAVGPVELVESQAADDAARLDKLIGESGFMATLIGSSEAIRPVGRMAGYARRVDRLAGTNYALLGNAAEFLDPIFSSGVTIALCSASLASAVLDRQLRGEYVDWLEAYELPLRRGVDTFRAHVEAWYDHSLQELIFDYPSKDNFVTSMITSVLAGYAWDSKNPFVRDPSRYLTMVREIAK